MTTRKQIEELILSSLSQNSRKLKEQFESSKNEIGYFVLDDLFPKTFVTEIYEAFPKSIQLVKKQNLREYKYVGYQMDSFNPVLEDVLYAFQGESVVKKIAEICSLENILPDASLYAGGISLMEKDNFLNPHLDNSHDKNRNLWRVLNLLYYVTPEWKLENGGNLELWPKGLKENAMTIESTCNRLVVMTTHQKSWHSVSKVVSNNARSCISNYYFSNYPLSKEDNFHVTTFRGRPKEIIKDFILKYDSLFRGTIRKVFKKGIVENKHQYKK
tara:strand:- start:207 stop:1022 length:816 start_codon:yes stop_codon:yes gene_type:complete